MTYIYKTNYHELCEFTNTIGQSIDLIELMMVKDETFYQINNN